jgi:hypothetical protein
MLKNVTFEPGSRLGRIDEATFGWRGSLESICIPKSVEILGDHCFGQYWRLESVTFELGGKVRRIENNAFAECSRLKSICIPASLEILGNHCFANCGLLERVTFESGCKVRRIENYAFLQCSALRSICIPASLEIVGESAFHNCESLANVTFECDLNLNRIEKSAFESCVSLKSFCVPASVEIIGENCFRCCTRLATLTIEPNSKLRRIRPGSFDQCLSLKPTLIPLEAEMMRNMSGSNYCALSRLRFDCPSNVYRLMFAPPETLTSVEIPDSVERVCCSLEFNSTRHFVLNFGSKSSLREIRFEVHRDHRQLFDAHLSRNTYRKSRVFVRLSESALKGFRSALELYDGRILNILQPKPGICMSAPSSHRLDFEH